MTSQRVERVKEFAKEHAANDKAWKVVSEMEDREIYNIVKQTQSPEGAIRKIARMIGSEHGAKIELPAPTRIQSMNEAERKLQELAGTADGTTQLRYDDAEHHVPSARELRSDVARRAVRGAGGAAHPLHEETTEEQLAAQDKKAAEAAKESGAKDAEKKTS